MPIAIVLSLFQVAVLFAVVLGLFWVAVPVVFVFSVPFSFRVVWLLRCLAADVAVFDTPDEQPSGLFVSISTDGVILR
ncbi:hypothetical protein [Bifidobacterium panos]|uniref:hypothetical protein n=1 Tax=Bifidobacterium panos TaxID=2675321 RepID=UPI0015572395|nr:hypothetical protein [Bifidobacterium sp. DSM 109963]